MIISRVEPCLRGRLRGELISAPESPPPILTHTPPSCRILCWLLYNILHRSVLSHTSVWAFMPYSSPQQSKWDVKLIGLAKVAVLCHSSGWYWLDSHSEDLLAILGQFTWDLWSTKWHLGRHFSDHFQFLNFPFHECCLLTTYLLSIAGTGWITMIAKMLTWLNL
jgi:hypothetical protein